MADTNNRNVALFSKHLERFASDNPDSSINIVETSVVAHDGKMRLIVTVEAQQIGIDLASKPSHAAILYLDELEDSAMDIKHKFTDVIVFNVAPSSTEEELAEFGVTNIIFKRINTVNAEWIEAKYIWNYIDPKKLFWSRDRNFDIYVECLDSNQELHTKPVHIDAIRALKNRRRTIFMRIATSDSSASIAYACSKCILSFDGVHWSNVVAQIGGPAGFHNSLRRNSISTLQAYADGDNV